ncbi:hypothetical protein A2Y83_00405 [Candidatus Falkowbacteria bacterium RBG_13_39_14]|uniref:Uncharacterized protein n=1 Tax=Candidatus Falkowbacteria bacterium RBG_13_39_14 TaxID=1797985 RepID=A0A1F5S7W4_9BACT|nr:MAG: hypothetical protein A2Y83_00405 [Candidatus Falkowbacteria bacterium RBG_13_39_14]
MSKTTVTSIAILLIILPFIVFTLKSKNISYGFRYGYECSCFGIVKPANDNYAEVNKCYGIPFNCIGYAQNAPNFVLKLLLYCLPALIFLCGIFIKRKIASKIFSSGIDNIKRIVNKKNIIIIFVITKLWQILWNGLI